MEPGRHIAYHRPMPTKGKPTMQTAAAKTDATDDEAVRIVVLFEKPEADALDALVDRLNANAREKREARRYNRSTVLREAVALMDAATTAKPRKP